MTSRTGDAQPGSTRLGSSMLLALGLGLICALRQYLPPAFSPELDIYFFPFIVAFALILAFRLSAKWVEVAVAAVLFLSLSYVLVGRWHNGLSAGEIIAGRIAFNDQAAYLIDALKLWDGHKLAPFSSRRPIHVLVLASILKLAGGDFQIASFLFAGFGAIAMTALAVAVRRTHGVAAAVVLAVLSVLFYRRFIGTAMSEHAGFIFGTLATALLWRGAMTRSPIELCGGLFMLTLALEARAGCFLVLPFVVLWIGWTLRTARGPSWRAIGLGLGAVLAGALVNWILLHSFGKPGAAFANFPVVLYGLISGGDWTSYYTDHPDLVSAPEAVVASRVMEAIVQRLRDDPWLLPIGMVRAWHAFFSVGQGQFSFLLSGSALQNDLSQLLSGKFDALPYLLARIANHFVLPLPSRWARYICIYLPWSMSALGAAVSLMRPRSPHTLLLAACWIGIILSVPFAPPWDGDLSRVYAATMPLQLLLVAVGVSKVGALLKAGLPPPESTLKPVSDPILARSLGLAVVACFVPILATAALVPAAVPVSAAPLSCATGEPHLVRAVRGTDLILRDRPDSPTALSIENFQTGLAVMVKVYPETFQPFLDLTDGTILAAAMTLDERAYQVVATRSPDTLRTLQQSGLSLCVTHGVLLVDADRPQVN